MARGLMSSGAAGSETPPPGQTPEQQGVPAEGEGNTPPADAGGGDTSQNGQQASPEEQQQYEQFLDAAFRVIYDPKAMPTILDRLKLRGKGLQEDESAQAIDALAQTAVLVFKRVLDGAKEQGVDFPGDVLYHAGVAVLEDIGELAGKAKIYDYTQEELNGAWTRAVDLYAQMGTKDGTVDKDAAQQDWHRLVQTQKDGGDIDQVVPGLGEAAKQMQSMAGRGKLMKGKQGPPGSEPPPPAQDQPQG